MALSDPRVVFGVDVFTPYNRTTGLPFGTIRVLGTSSLSLSGELVKLNGGSNRYPFAIEDGLITAELSLTVRELPDFLFELFLGKAPTANSSESAGSVTAIANKKGTSVVAATGIASVGVKSGSEADAKFSKYVVKAVSATTVDVFALSGTDFARGADKSFENDALKITASALTITQSSAVEVPGFGIELTGDSGVIAMVADDTAEFTVRPINDQSIDVTFGAETDIFPEFGALIVAQKRGNGEMFEIDLFRVKGIGLPLGFEEKSWNESEITAEAFFDSAKGGVASIRHINPSTTN